MFTRVHILLLAGIPTLQMTQELLDLAGDCIERAKHPYYPGCYWVHPLTLFMRIMRGPAGA